MTDHSFKTLYFPRERVRDGVPRRVTISLPSKPSAQLPEDLLDLAVSLPSAEFRRMLGDPFIEDLEDLAQADGRSFSNVCLRIIQSRTAAGYRPDARQLQVPITSRFAASGMDLGLTFQDSRSLPVHGWYPYVEGFSAPYVEALIGRFGVPNAIYDPFGGAGTAMLAAACVGVPSYYSEINPFMSFVSDTKTRSAIWCRQHLDETTKIAGRYLEALSTELPRWAKKIDLSSYEAAFPGRDFFEEQHLRDLLGARELAYQEAAEYPEIRDVLLLACASNAVHASNMTRRADLRRRRSDEYKTRVVNVEAMIKAAVEKMVSDIRGLPEEVASCIKVSEDCRAVPKSFRESVDLAITSPPYLNGTNYFRNTKIELWLLGLIESEADLSSFRAQAVAAGINNISASRSTPQRFECVEIVAEQLDECAGDRRIPAMVRHYFSDMSEVLGSVYQVLRPGGRFVLDIGDSQYYGVHVPTDRLLEAVGLEAGFDIEETTILARRHSRDKSPLVQREIVFRRPVRQRASK